MGRQAPRTFTRSRVTRLPEQLAARGVSPERIDMVVNTHLHFDHCGWNTRDADGKAVPTFPQRAVRGAARGTRTRPASHRARPRQLFPGKFRADGGQPGNGGCSTKTCEIAPGVELIRVPGHNARHDVCAAHRRRTERPCSWPIWCPPRRTCRRRGSWDSTLSDADAREQEKWIAGDRRARAGWRSLRTIPWCAARLRTRGKS